MRVMLCALLVPTFFYLGSTSPTLAAAMGQMQT